ncbi:hypothetical protein CAPTEDRAFT_191539 [Capitella teleta]|uniref:Endonuclease/exonuclease/phosphatase domain-containing protein n=1 Tax=Capitella teleta TaxID=283909 RepID=R7U2W7_CAPTE|nr:hypothetical protein CAPTEDRAFT_191539 [Capitella teleta]|eukprot:ELU00218.1 hypothetical protein CAPTEDRAFT_191539 [Capitella teleta]
MKLRLASLNSKDLGAGKIDYIRSLFNSHDLVLLQEHWQLHEQLVVFNAIQDNLQEYDDVLRELSALLETDDNDRVILGGDLNTDFNRASLHSLSHQRFINDESFVTPDQR